MTWIYLASIPAGLCIVLVVVSNMLEKRSR